MKTGLPLAGMRARYRKPSWAHPYAIQALDFRNNRYMSRGVQYAFADLASVTRVGTGWLDNISGVWSEFLAGVLRRTDRGAAISGQFTNKIRNPRGEGGTIGVVGSGGVLPTNFAVLGGLNVEFLGAGLETGLAYFDVRFFGTASANYSALYFEGTSNAIGTPGQAWGLDTRVKALAGTQPGSALAVYKGGTATVFQSSVFTPDGTKQYVSKRGVLEGGVTYLRPYIISSITNGVVYDFAIRIYAPKLVQIAVIEGPELITNGDFASAAGWATPTGWSISAGKLNALNPASGLSSYRDMLVRTAGEVLKLSFEVSNYVAGTFRSFISSPGTVSGQYVTANGAYTDYLLATSTQSLAGAQPFGNDLSASIDNFSLKLLTAGYMPTFPILPPIGVPGDSTKLVDDVRSKDLAWFTDAGLSAGATELALVTLTHVGDSTSRILFEYSDGTSANYIRGVISATGVWRLVIVTANVQVVNVALSAVESVGRKAFAFGWSATGGYISDGTQTVTFGPIALPTVTQKRFGGGYGGSMFNDIIEQNQTCRPLSASDGAAWVLAA